MYEPGTLYGREQVFQGNVRLVVSIVQRYADAFARRK